MKDMENNDYMNKRNNYLALRIDLVKHVLLLLLTFGIWQLIWVYKTTANLNAVPGSEQRDPVTKLLLYMFVPFYFIYWTYKTSLIVDAFSGNNGRPSDTATLNLILSLFVNIVPPILIQNSLNNTVDFIFIQDSDQNPNI